MKIFYIGKEFNPKFDVGNNVYLVRALQTTELCPRCKGNGFVSITTEDSQHSEACPECGGVGTVNRTKYLPDPVPAVVEKVKLVFGKTAVEWKYVVSQDGKMLNRSEDSGMFTTPGAAAAYCRLKNQKRVVMKLEDIRIPPRYLKTFPSAEKIAKRMQELRDTGKFTNMIEVNENGELVDGYTTYVLAKGFGFAKLEVIVHDGKEEA